MSDSKLTRFDRDTSTCNKDSLYKGFFDGFFGKFQDSFFFSGVIQFLIVTLMYVHVGKGKYWRMLFYAAIASFFGSILENATVAYICLESKKENLFSVVIPFLICELFWIPAEYSIPYLNLIKMEAFTTKEKVAKIVKCITIFLTFPFIVFRFLIGYERMMNGFLQSPTIHAYHGYAFSVLALSDILCTICILYYVKRNSRNAVKTTYINTCVKYSSYTILICIDIVSSILSILNIATNMGPFKDYIPGSYVTPLHCLKCSFILILAADALLFKYEAGNASSVHEHSKSFGCSTGSNNFLNSNKRNLYNRINSENNLNNSGNCLINIRSKSNLSVNEVNTSQYFVDVPSTSQNINNEVIVRSKNINEEKKNTDVNNIGGIELQNMNNKI